MSQSRLLTIRRLALFSCLTVAALVAQNVASARAGSPVPAGAVRSDFYDDPLNRFMRGLPVGAPVAPSFLRANSPLLALVPGGTPFTGAPLPIPGVIQAEDFDNGGDGVAYHDTTAANEGGYHRTAGVDITSTYAGLNVGWTQAGEWLEYTVNVAATDTYRIEVIAATPLSTGNVHVEVDGVNVTGNMPIPNTGGWGNYASAVKSGVLLTAGTHVLRVSIDGYGFLFDYVRFTNEQSPFGGTLWPVPGTIQAEDFDNGGEGISYHDTTAANEGGQYRTTGVDITSTFAGQNIGWTQAGEWLEYTVNVAATGTYTFQAITATPVSYGVIHFEVDGVDVTGPMVIPNTGGWNSYGAATRTGVPLTAGTHVLRVGIDGYGFLLNSISILPSVPATPSGLTATATSTTQINLVWADNSSNETGFKIERKTGAGGTYAEIATAGAGVTSYSNTGLTSNTQYFYRVRATNTGGDSAYSNEAGATTNNQPPTVNLTAPANGSSYTAPAGIVLTATAFDADGGVAKVEFFQGATKLGEDAISPYSYVWSNVPTGSYSLTARATDTNGLQTTSAAAAVLVSLPTVTVSATDSAASEQGPDAGTFTVSRTGATTSALTVNYTVGGTATSVADYVSVGTSVTIPAGASSQAVTVTPVDDAVVENSGETVILTLATNAAYTVGTPASATVNIADNDTHPPTVSINSPAGGTVFNAYSSINILANASDSDPGGSIVKVEFFQNGIKLGEDTVAPYSYAWANVAPGSYSLTAKATDNAGATTTSAAVAVTVSLPTVTVTATDANASEQGLDAATFTVARTGGTGSALTVSYTLSGAATNGIDYGTLSGALTIPVGVSSQVVTVTPVDDAVVETNGETVVLTLSNNAAYTVGTPASATVNIADNDTHPPTVSINSPAGGTVFIVPASIEFNAAASDPDGTVAKVEFFQGATKLGEDTSAPYSFIWVNPAAGSYSLTAKATDNTGATGTSTAVSVVVNTPPAVSITSPSANMVVYPGANVQIEAVASDSDPGGSVTRVGFYVGETEIGADTIAPYAFTWQNVPAGAHVIKAVATDDRGATTMSIAVQVTAADFRAARLDPSNRTGADGVNPYSRNFNWSLPVVSLPGRAGLNLGLTLSYNSLVWTKDGASGAVTFDADRGFPGPGFRLGFPKIQPAFFNPQTGKITYLLITSAGALVELRQTETPGVYESADSSYLHLTDLGGTLALRMTDGTLLSFSPAGGEFVCHEVRDRNGNYVTAAYHADGRIDRVIDTLGRTATFNYDAGLRLTSITQPWKRETEANPNGDDESHQWATFAYTDVTLQPQFSNLAVANGRPGTVVSMLSRVMLPDGSYYAFEYNAWGQVWKVTHYAADAVNAGEEPNFSHPLTSTWIDLPGAGASQGGAGGVAATPQADCPRFGEMRVWVKNGVMGQSAEVTTGYDQWTMDMASCEVTMPDGTKQTNTYGTSADKWLRGFVKKEEMRDGGQLVRMTNIDWEHDGAPDALYPTNPRVTKTTVFDPQGNSRTTRLTYTTPEDFRWAGGYQGTLNVRLPRKVEECSDDNCSTVLRTSVTDYKVPNLGEYVSRRILGLPQFQLLYEGAEAGPNLRSKLGYVYDDTGHVEDDPQQPKFLQPLQSPAWQHYKDDHGVGLRWRGNVTRVRRYEVNPQNGTETGAFTERLAGYNVAGAAVFSRDAGEHLTLVSYADAFYAGVNRTHTEPQFRLQTFAYPTAVIDPDGFTSSTLYNYDMGVVTRAETPKPNGATVPPVVTHLYDAAGRPLKATAAPGGTYLRWEYGASGLFVRQLTKVDTDKPETFVLQVMDGMGSVVGVLREHPGEGTGYAASRTEHDPVNRVARQYNAVEVSVAAGNLSDSDAWVPAGPDATPQGRNGWPYTATEYDWKGRVRREVNADGSDRLTEYAGCGCAGGEIVTRQGEIVPIPGEGGSGRRTQRTYYDVLGRPRMSEMLNWGGSVYSSTTTAYDALDNVVRARTYAGAAPETEPGGEGEGYQTTTMTYDGYGRLKTQHLPKYNPNTVTAFEYNDDDTVRRVTDPRGVIADFTYNNRHLLERVAYNPAQSGAPDTPDLVIGYDPAGNRVSMTDEVGSLSYHHDALSRLTSETRQFNGITHRTYTLTYGYNLAGQLKSMTDPFGHTTTYGRNKAGHVTEVTGSGYPAIPQFAGGVQFTSGIRYRAWGAVRAANYGDGRGMTADYDSRLRVTGFHMPGPVTLDKAYQYEADGALKFADDLVDDVFDRSYTYDQVGRLAEAHTGEQARGGTADDGPYQQSYTYNPFGHVTAQNNVLWRQVVSGGSGQYQNDRRQGWSYDAAGDLTYDQLRHYVNDAAGRLRSFNSGLQSYAYDGNGQVARVTRNLGVATHVYNLRSTALGGEVVSQLKPHPGALDARLDIIHAGGAQVRRDVGGTGEFVTWSHEDPASTTVQEGGVSSFEGPNSTFNSPIVQVDPVGASVGWADPAQFEQPPAPPDETSPEMPVYNNPLRPGQGCSDNLVPLPCAEVLSRANGLRSYTLRSETTVSLAYYGSIKVGDPNRGPLEASDDENAPTRVYDGGIIPLYRVHRSLGQTINFSGYMSGGLQNPEDWKLKIQWGNSEGSYNGTQKKELEGFIRDFSGKVECNKAFLDEGLDTPLKLLVNDGVYIGGAGWFNMGSEEDFRKAGFNTSSNANAPAEIRQKLLGGDVNSRIAQAITFRGDSPSILDGRAHIVLKSSTWSGAMHWKEVIVHEFIHAAGKRGQKGYGHDLTFMGAQYVKIMKACGASATLP